MSTVKKPPRGVPADPPEAELDAGIFRLFGKHPCDYPEPERTSFRETLRLAVLYPDRFVVFRDHHVGANGDGLLRRREVLFVTDDENEFVEYVMTTLTDGERRTCGMWGPDRDRPTESPLASATPGKRKRARKPA